MKIPSRPALVRLIRFSIVGVCVALIYYLLFLGLRAVDTPRIAASTISFGVAVLIQYVAQTAWTFGARPLNRRYAIRFIVMVTTGAFLAAAITGLIGPALGARDAISALAVVITLPVFNYLVMSTWVYRDQGDERLTTTETKL